MPENTTSRPRLTPLIMFIVAFITVFFLVMITSTLITFMLPESFAGTARILVESDKPTVCAVIQSQAVLGAVIDKLYLNIEWGKKYFGGETLKTPETMEFLKRRMEIVPQRDARLINITVYSEDRNEAARIANAITDCYNDYCRDVQKRAESDHSTVTVPRIEIVDRATPQLEPAKPNKTLNIVLGALAGVVLGSLVGGISAYVASWLGRQRQGKATPP
jgi:uncharacterized protein involved in exopolysaccharide biosynthesis